MCRRMLTELSKTSPQSSHDEWAIYFPAWRWISEGTSARLLVTKSRRSQEKRPGTSWMAAQSPRLSQPCVESIMIARGARATIALECKKASDERAFAFADASPRPGIVDVEE